MPETDLIWAYRYAWFVWHKKNAYAPLITNEEYDALVTEVCAYGTGEQEYACLKQHNGWPDEIKTLALYLAKKHGMADKPNGAA